LSPVNLADLEYEIEPQDKVVFLHIPKTAGISLRPHIESNFDRSKIIKPWISEQLIELGPTQVLPYQLIEGHVHYDVARQILRQPFIGITMLREPIDRHISNLAYAKERIEHFIRFNILDQESIRKIGATDVIGLLEDRDIAFHKMLGNAQTRLISERFEDLLTGNALKLKLKHPANAEHAQQLLETFAFFGLTERFHDSLKILSYTFGWFPPGVSHTKMNKTRKRPLKDTLSSEIVDFITGCNQLDMQLYHYAHEQFEIRFTQMTHSLLSRFGTRAQAHLPHPLPEDILTELLERHYEDRFTKRHHSTTALYFPLSKRLDGENWVIISDEPGRWTGSKSAAILDLPVSMQASMEILLGVRHAIAPDVLKSIRLSINEQPVELTVTSVPPLQVFRARIPDGLTTTKPFTRLEITVDHTATPEFLAGQPNEQQVGVAVDWVRFRAASLATSVSAQRPGARALLVIPHNVSYFYNLAGKRLAETLIHLGWEAELCPSGSMPQLEHYDLCVLLNIDEIIYSLQNPSAAKEYLSQLRKCSSVLASFAMEAVGTPWFDKILKLGQDAWVDYLIDAGLHTQQNRLPAFAQSGYQFLFNGLTVSEQQELATQPVDIETRPIPWAFVAHLTPTRMDIARRLIAQVNPSGFLYLARLLSPISENGPHLNDAQFKSVLRKSRLQVWCSHHENPYLESERFRTSLLTGSLPIKILLYSQKPETFPLFQYLLLDETEFASRLGKMDVSAMFKRFADDVRKLPSLGASLQVVLNNMKLPTQLTT
jgi:hypothetical protein